MRLDGWNWQDMTLHAPAGMRLNFPPWPRAATTSEDEGESSSKAMEALDEMIEQAEHYAKAKAAGTVDHDPKMEGLCPSSRASCRSTSPPTARRRSRRPSTGPRRRSSTTSCS